MVGKVPQMLVEAPFVNERNRITRPWLRFLQLIRDNVVSTEDAQTADVVATNATIAEFSKVLQDIIALSSVPDIPQKIPENDGYFQPVAPFTIVNDNYHPPVIPPIPTGIIIERQSSYTTTVTLKIDEGMVFLDASGGVFTVTLPFAAGATKRVIRLKRTEAGANNITIASQAGDNVDGAATFVLLGGSLGFIDLVSDGTDWWIIG